MSQFGWKFEKSESGDSEGLNDGGVETFRDDHLLSLAKESAQNSLDARADKSKPVILEFNTFYIDQKDFLDLENYQKMIDLQIEYWKQTKNDKTAVEFFKKAKKALDQPKIFCLRISDFNTTGLEGSKEGKDEPFSNWFKLVRSKGVTDNNSLAGGSFGLGKFASFACSKLRTVFYSTMDLKGIEAYQGVTILASHDTEEGERTRGRGYFCNIENFSCIPKPLALDPSFKRNEPGTDIYILGFVDNDDELKDKLFSSILRSFLLAIYEGNLIFKLDGKTLEKKTLKKTMDKYRNEIYRTFVPKEVIGYYDILEGNLEYEEYFHSIKESNDVSLKIAVGPGLSKRIGMFRNNGMKIFDGKGFKSFNDFVGILTLKGDEVNAYFRNLENPEHSDWRPERSDEPAEAKETIKNLLGFVNKRLKELENKTLPESENMDGIDSLQDEDFNEEGKKPIEGLEFKPLNILESKNKRNPKKKIKVEVSAGTPSEGEERTDEPIGPDPTPNPFPKPGDKPGENLFNPGDDETKKTTMEVFPDKLRLFQGTDGNYLISFSIPEKTENLSLKVYISGEELNEALNISSAKLIAHSEKKDLTIKENIIKVGDIEANEKQKIEFNLEDNNKWALEVRFYEN